MYKAGLAAAIVQNGNVLREKGEYVYLPFGSEYEILLKNLTKKRAVISIKIDGKSVTNGNIVVPAESSVNLERYITNSTVGNRFKFIKKTQKIEEHRGNRAEDGIVEISYQFEKPRKFDGWWTTYYVSEYPFSSSFDEEKIEYTVDDNTRSCMNMTSTSYSESNEGITVPGSTSHQDFVITSVKELEPEEYKIFIKLTGQHKDTPIREPVTTKKRATCPTCGTSHKNNANFCSHCGTALQIF